jgi:hypothetical protein
MLSEADLIAKRATLRWLAKPHPSGPIKTWLMHPTCHVPG